MFRWLKKFLEPSPASSYENGQIHVVLELYELDTEGRARKAAKLHEQSDRAVCETEAHRHFVRGVRDKLEEWGYPREGESKKDYPDSH